MPWYVSVLPVLELDLPPLDAMNRCSPPNTILQHLKQLDVCVKQVTLGHMDAFATQFMHQLQDSGGDDGLAAGGCVGKGTLGCGILACVREHREQTDGVQ